MEDISIAVISSYKLAEKHMACKDTWAKDFDNVYFFGGSVEDPELIKLDAEEDYNSYFPKQQLSLKYMFEKNPNIHWYSVIGCDHIYFKNRLMEQLNKFNYNEDYILGETHDHVTRNVRKINIEGVEVYLIAGGGGIFISNSLMKKLYNKIDEFMDYWKYLYDSRIYGGYPHGDVALCVMAKKYFNVDPTHMSTLHSQHPLFYPPNDIVNPSTFHYIQAEEMEQIYNQFK